MIPLVDLKAQYRSIKDEIDAAIFTVLEDTSFILGPSVTAFEEKFAAYTASPHAIGVNSGTSALHLALLAAGIGPGDEVIAPAMTFLATASAIEYAGARPVLVDIDPERYTLDPERIEAALTPATKAIMPVHLYGQPTEMEPILDLAQRHGLLVIEDAAQAHGAEYRGQRCGSLSDIACFSFYPGKNLGAFGEGGAVTTKREDLAQRVRMLRDWGQKQKGVHLLRGFNYRLEGIQGAVLGVKMNHIERWTEGRRRVAQRYDELLAGVPGVTIPSTAADTRHVYHVYAILVENRATVAHELKAAGVASGVHYPTPVHLQPCFQDLGYHEGDFPVAERVAREELSLPIFAELQEEQIQVICEAVKRAVSKGVGATK